MKSNIKMFLLRAVKRPEGGRDGRTLVNNSRVTFHLYLIGQEDGTRFLDKWQNTVMQK